MRKYNVLGVSAGQGALLFPWKLAGHNVVGNVESRTVFHTKHEEQWKTNFGNALFTRSLYEDEVLNHKVDVIVSSPDCGASSIMRLSKVKELGKPDKNPSLNLVIEAINHFKPKVFLIENLPRLISLLPKNFFETSLPEYKLVYHCCSVSEFGNSQVSRKRLVIVGVLKKKSKLLHQFDKLFKVNSLTTTNGVLNQLVTTLDDDQKLTNSDGNYIPQLSKKLAMYDYRKLPEKKNLTVKKIQKLWTTDFKSEKKWPIKTAKMLTLPGVYRLESEKAPLTLRPADRQFRPDGWPLGILDFKNIMGFPKEFSVYINIEDYNYTLNKARYALAKGSVYEVGEWFLRCFLAK